MKLKFKISRATNLNPQIVIDRITKKLDNDNYRILNVTDDTVEFDESPWKIMWNFQAARRLDGGKFEIHESDNLFSITFSYYRSLIAPVVILIAISVGLIIEEQYYAPLFFLAFYVIILGFNMITLRGVAEEMLDEIVK